MMIKNNLLSFMNSLQEYFGGDCEVVILPSGAAVRIKNTIVADQEKDADKKNSQAAGSRRKRKQSEAESHQMQHPATPIKMGPAFEVFPPG